MMLMMMTPMQKGTKVPKLVSKWVPPDGPSCPQTAPPPPPNHHIPCVYNCNCIGQPAPSTGKSTATCPPPFCVPPGEPQEEPTGQLLATYMRLLQHSSGDGADDSASDAPSFTLLDPVTMRIYAERNVTASLTVPLPVLGAAGSSMGIGGGACSGQGGAFCQQTLMEECAPAPDLEALLAAACCLHGGGSSDAAGASAAGGSGGSNGSGSGSAATSQPFLLGPWLEAAGLPHPHNPAASLDLLLGGSCASDYSSLFAEQGEGEGGGYGEAADIPLPSYLACQLQQLPGSCAGPAGTGTAARRASSSATVVAAAAATRHVLGAPQLQMGLELLPAGAEAHAQPGMPASLADASPDDDEGLKHELQAMELVLAAQGEQEDEHLLGASTSQGQPAASQGESGALAVAMQLPGAGTAQQLLSTWGGEGAGLDELRMQWAGKAGVLPELLLPLQPPQQPQQVAMPAASPTAHSPSAVLQPLQPPPAPASQLTAGAAAFAPAAPDSAASTAPTVSMPAAPVTVPPLAEQQQQQQQPGVSTIEAPGVHAPAVPKLATRRWQYKQLSELAVAQQAAAELEEQQQERAVQEKGDTQAAGKPAASAATLHMTGVSVRKAHHAGAVPVLARRRAPPLSLTQAGSASSSQAARDGVVGAGFGQEEDAGGEDAIEDVSCSSQGGAAGQGGGDSPTGCSSRPGDGNPVEYAEQGHRQEEAQRVRLGAVPQCVGMGMGWRALQLRLCGHCCGSAPDHAPSKGHQARVHESRCMK